MCEGNDSGFVKNNLFVCLLIHLFWRRLRQGLYTVLAVLDCPGGLCLLSANIKGMDPTLGNFVSFNLLYIPSLASSQSPSPNPYPFPFFSEWVETPLDTSPPWHFKETYFYIYLLLAC